MNKDFKYRIVKAINKGISEALDLTLDDDNLEDNDIIKVNKDYDIEDDNLQNLMNKAVQNKDWNKIKILYEKANIQYTVETKEELQQIIKDYISFAGNECDLNWIDTHLITDMSYLFHYMTSFNCNISKWNVSNVTNKLEVFYKCPIKKEYKPKFK